MATREEKQRRRALINEERVRRYKIGVRPAERPLTQLVQAERRLQQQKSRTEEEEAGRIAGILGGLKQGAKRTMTKENIGKAAAATGRAAQAAGQKVKAGGKGAWAAGGAVAGYTAAKAGSAKQAVGRGVEKTKAAAGFVKAQFTASEIIFFFIVCCAVFIVDFITEFGSADVARFIGYLLLALWGRKFFDQPTNIAKHLLLIYFSFAGAALLINLILPQEWVIAFPIFTVFYLIIFFYPAVKLGLSSFLVSGIAFSAPIVPGIVQYYIAPIDFFQITVSGTTKFTIDLIATLMALSWVLYLSFLRTDWSVLQRKPKILQVSGFVIATFFVISLAPAFAEVSKSSPAAQEIMGTIDASSLSIKTASSVKKGAEIVVEAVKNFPKKLSTKSKETYTQYMDFATAGYYSENVEMQQLDTWVVEIPEAYAWEGEFQPGQVTVEVVFSGTRKEGEKLHITGVNRLNFSCRTKGSIGEPQVEGKASPNSAYLINLLGGEYTNVGKQSVTCTLPLTKSATVDVIGSFDLSATSELPVLLTTAEKKAALSNTQQIRQYQLNPIAKPIGAGPVTIALEFEEPYPVIAEPNLTTQLKITVEDHDDLYGRIQKLYGFRINLAEGMELGECRVRKDEKTTLLTKNKDGTLDTDSIEYPIESYAAFKCEIKFTKDIGPIFEIQSTTAQKDVATKKISASAKYQYEIARGVRVNIAETSGVPGGGVVGDENFPVTQITASEQQVIEYLQKNAGSQLQNKGGVFYRYGVDNKVDPAFGIAVSQKETTLSKATCSKIPSSCNNFFCMKYEAVAFTGLSTGSCGGSVWAGFDSADNGIKAFFIYIKTKYIEATPQQLTPAQITCAPGSGVTSHCYCADCPTWANWAKDVARYRAAVSGRTSIAVTTTPIPEDATPEGKRVLETARAMRGYVDVDSCWDACKDIYERAGMKYRKVCSTGEAYNSPEIITKRCTPLPGDILQIPSSGSPTGEHNVIFDHIESGSMVVWNSPGAGKPLQQRTYSTPPEIYIIWEPYATA